MPHAWSSPVSNWQPVFFFGQYGQPDKIGMCREDRHGVWTRYHGQFMPAPKNINGVLVCAPGDLIERLGASAVAARIEAVRCGREPAQDGGGQATAVGVPRLPGGAEDNAEAEGSTDVRDAQNGMRTWAKQWGSKRWHALKIEKDGSNSDMSLCGRRILATRQGAISSWHVACSACLHVIHRKRLKRNPYSK